jgi:hypothetical protein
VDATRTGRSGHDCKGQPHASQPDPPLLVLHHC